MNQQQPDPTKIHAIVELMGKTSIAGEIMPDPLFPALLRIDVPAVEGQPAWTKTVNPSSSVYAINYCTEETARAHAERIKARPLHLFDIRQTVAAVEEVAMRKQLHHADPGVFDTPDQDFGSDYEEADPNDDELDAHLRELSDPDYNPADQDEW